MAPGEARIDARPGAANRLVLVGLGIDTLTRAAEAQVDFSDFQINAP